MTTTNVGSQQRATTHAGFEDSWRRVELMRHRLQLAFWTLGMTLAALVLIAMLAQHFFVLADGARLGSADVAIAIGFAMAAQGSSSRRRGQL